MNLEKTEKRDVYYKFKVWWIEWSKYMKQLEIKTFCHVCQVLFYLYLSCVSSLNLFISVMCVKSYIIYVCHVRQVLFYLYMSCVSSLIFFISVMCVTSYFVYICHVCQVLFYLYLSCVSILILYISVMCVKSQGI